MAKWSAKDERQYEHIKEGLTGSGRKASRASEIAARTVNKQRREEGRTPARTTQGTGNPRTRLEERTKDELYNIAKSMAVAGRSSMSKTALVDAIRERR